MAEDIASKASEASSASLASHTTSNLVIHSYKELIVWQRAVELVTEVYKLTQKFPNEERYTLSAQMRSAAISIPSNIAEGRSRGTKKDYLQFLRTAYASGAELETQIIIAKRLPQTQNLNFSIADSLLQEVVKMLYVMIKKLNPSVKSS